VPRISIVITNHNYERFLPAALSSALGQRDADVEVIAVDDGSTDGSREILAREASRVRVILQENLGQKAAFNAGLAAATGDVVLFLDADDELKPDTAAAVAAAFAANPEAAGVVFRLEVVDEEGKPTGAPSSNASLARGDVREQVLAYPDDLAWPATSGNAFAAWALRCVMPLALDGDPTGADQPLHTLIPLFGPMVALDRIGGSYRLHSGNRHLREEFDVSRSRMMVERAQWVHRDLDRVARELGYGGARPRSVTVAAHRLISLRLGGPGHPVPGDTRTRAVAAGLRAARGRTDVGLLKRAAYASWFLAAAVAPRSAVRGLASVAFPSPVHKPLLRRLAAR
jgi:glycosyltransferase involved in cell wall biosynthesis